MLNGSVRRRVFLTLQKSLLILVEADARAHWQTKESIMKIMYIGILIAIFCSGRIFCMKRAGEGQDEYPKKARVENTDEAVHKIVSLPSAIRENDRDAVIQLLDRGADIGARYPFGYTALFYAIFKESREIVELLLERGADANEVYDSGDSPLKIAIGYYHRNPDVYQEIVRLLISKGACIDDKIFETLRTWYDDALFNVLLEACSDKKRALLPQLYQAASEGQESLVQELLNQGADVNGQNALLQTALFLAVNNGHTQVAKLLLDRGADACILSRPNNHDFCGIYNADRLTPLDLAACNGNEELVELLIQPRSLGKDDLNSALGYAAGTGHSDLVRKLLEYGAEINSDYFHDGLTPLILALYDKHEETVQLLLERGADTKNDNGHNPLSLAIEKGSLALVTRILGLGGYQQLRQDEGKQEEDSEDKILLSDLAGFLEKKREQEGTLLLDILKDSAVQTYLKEYGDHRSTPKDALQEWLKTKGNYERNESKQTMLMWASVFGHSDALKIMLNSDDLPQWYINAQDTYGNTALIYAIHYGHFDIAQMLIPYCKSGINLKDAEGKTALFHAVTIGNEQLVQALLSHKAKFGNEDQAVLALKYAAEQGYTKIAFKLLGYFSQTAKHLNKGYVLRLF
jgi:ankyrin repeat protein